MIIDNIKNADKYFGVSERIKKGLTYLRETNFLEVEPGRYDIDGDNIYAMVTKYTTKPIQEGKWEAHRKYMDIHYIVSGKEQMGYVYIKNLKGIIKEYDTESDCLLFKGQGDMFEIKAGTFAILFTHDAHMPQITKEKDESVLKVVVKVKQS